MKHDFHMNQVYLTLACALAWGGALAQSKSPFELLTPEDAQRVSKYYEVQFGSERRDEMIQHVSINRRLLQLASNCENSKYANLVKRWREEAGLLFLAFAGEDYSAAQVCKDEWRGVVASEPVSKQDKEFIIAAATRGGPSTGFMHAWWLIRGVEVLKDEEKGWSQLSKCARFSVRDMQVYSARISNVKSKTKEGYYAEIVFDFPNYFFGEDCLSAAMFEAREKNNHVDYLALGYVGMVRYRHKQTDSLFLGRPEYTGIDPSRVLEYEEKFGDKSSSWAPWSPPNRIVAQEKAATIQQRWKQLIREPADASVDPMDSTTHRAHDGDSVAMYDVGVCYLGGTMGFPKNPEAARRWFGFSSARGFVPGSYNFANCLMQGVGGPADLKEAARLFRLCALRADPLSQHNLGSAYANGRGVDRDHVEAAAWWLVCEAKVPEAKSNIAKLSAVAGPGLMSKAKARSEVLRKEINSFLDERKKDLIW